MEIKLIKLGMIGADSFHGEAFGNLCKDNKSPLYKKVSVEAIWWNDIKQAEKLASKIKVKRIEKNIEDVFRNIDAVMLINRFGNERFEIIKKILKFKKPIFIDKPIATDIKQAKTIVNLCKENKIKIMSSSALRFAEDVQKFKKLIKSKKIIGGTFFVPAECNDLGKDERFNDLSFYGVHTTELLHEIFGSNFILNDFNVNADRGYIAVVSNNNINVVINFLKNTNNFFSIIAFSRDEVFNLNIDLEGSFFQKTLEIFINFLNGKKLSFSNKDVLHSLNLILSIEKKVLR